MIHAYDKNYLFRAQGLLASMLDFAVHDIKIPLEKFYNKFLDSRTSSLFESGDTSVLAGKSGVELALDVTGDYSKARLYRPTLNRSSEYWTGWALAYFQWYSGLQFRQIEYRIPISEIHAMYNPYHEMDISQFCDKMIELYKSRNMDANLKIIRTRSGLSQTELSKISEVPVRTIQQYEQKQKSINSAKVETVLKLARALSVSVEDLLEL